MGRGSRFDKYALSRRGSGSALTAADRGRQPIHGLRLDDVAGSADRFGSTIYEAVDPELAQRRGLPLATLDVELRKAARALGTPLLGV
jgi:hypothetical protein